MPTNVKDLVELIDCEFAKTVYPGDTNLAQELIYYSDYEGNSVKAFFQGKRWQEITYSTLDQNCKVDTFACLSFLQPEGFRYYLPAFLKIALDFERSGEIADAICRFLALPGLKSPEEDKELFFSRIAGLSDGQITAVVQTLEFLSAQYKRAGYPDDPADEALCSYWKQVAKEEQSGTGAD